MSTLTAVQQQIVELIAAGQSVTAAAAHHGLHRTTLHHWARTNPEFAQALADAKEDAADNFRAECHAHAAKAIDAMAAVLDDPKASPSVKLRAALFLLNGALGKPARAPKARGAKSPIQHNSSLFITSTPDQSHQPAPSAPVHHNSSLFITSAQNEKPQPIRRTGPKIGRNEPCPCGSGRKHKTCCLNRRTLSAQAV